MPVRDASPGAAPGTATGASPPPCGWSRASGACCWMRAATPKSAILISAQKESSRLAHLVRVRVRVRVRVGFGVREGEQQVDAPG